MKFLKWTRIAILACLLLAIRISLSTNHPILTAYGQSSPPKLDSTEWKGAVDVGKINEFDSITIDCTYLFRKDGKVKVDFLNSVAGYELKQQYNSIKGVWEQAMPVWNPLKSAINGSEVCTYKQAGNSVNIKCGSWDIDATIQNNKMEGEINLQSFRKKVKWLVERVSSGNSEPSNSSHPHTVRNADGTLRPANGYRWVNPKDPKDFRVERIP